MNQTDIEIKMYRTSCLMIVNYCYLIFNKKTSTAFLVDPAWDFALFKSELAANHVDLKGILLTHHHYDHVNLADSLAKYFNAPVFMSSKEIDFYRFSSHNLSGIEHLSRINLGGIEITPYLTPGHTCGSICYLAGNHLFSGDTLFIEGCGLCEGRGADPGVMFDTVQYLKQTISSETLICPGHSYGQPLCQPFKQLFDLNIYLQINDRNTFIDFRMRKSQPKLFDFR